MQPWVGRAFSTGWKADACEREGPGWWEVAEEPGLRQSGPALVPMLCLVTGWEQPSVAWLWHKQLEAAHLLEGKVSSPPPWPSQWDIKWTKYYSFSIQFPQQHILERDSVLSVWHITKGIKKIPLCLYHSHEFSVNKGVLQRLAAHLHSPLAHLEDIGAWPSLHIRESLTFWFLL